MKTRLFPLLFIFLALLVFSATAGHPQTIMTFDDIVGGSNGFFETAITNGYQGLSWSNFYCLNPFLYDGGHVTSGALYGMVSLSNVAFNGFAGPAEIDSPGTNFNFLSVYLTGGWNSNLTIEVEGFNGAQEIYDRIVSASATNPTLFTFDYFDIDRLYFNAYGGEPAFAGHGSFEQFVMDNFMFEFIPEPSSFLLAALGAVSLVAFLRRKRRK